MDYLHTETTYGACLRPKGLATRQNRVRISMQHPAEIPEVQFPDSLCQTDSVRSACLRLERLATPENRTQIMQICRDPQDPIP